MKIALIANSAGNIQTHSSYAENARDYGYRDIEMIVVGDRGETNTQQALCDSLSRLTIPCRLLSVDAQRDLVQANCPDLLPSIRFDSPRRHHLGLLDAWLNGSSVMIVIDPTTRAPQYDYVGAHLSALETRQTFQLPVRGEWFNQAATMVERENRPFSMRGYPVQVSIEQAIPAETLATGSPAAHSGIAAGSSDLDAATRLRGAFDVLGPRPEIVPRFTLPPGVWAPFAVHNLSLRRDAVPAYFLTPYAGRFDDIWAGFMLTRIAHHLGHCISFGSPNLILNTPASDLNLEFEQELVGYRQSLPLSAALRSIPLTGTSFHDCFGEIAAALPGAWTEIPGMSGIEIEARNRLLQGIRQWHQLFASIAARSKVNLFESIAESSATRQAAEAISRFT